MRTRKAGQIVNITSLAGVVPLPFWGLYAASKFALEGLTETLRYELTPFGVSVSAIEAGYIKTPLYSAERKTRPIADYRPWHARFSNRVVHRRNDTRVHFHRHGTHRDERACVPLRWFNV